MDSLIDRYNALLEKLVFKEKERKYIHYRSLHNFIIHLDEFTSENNYSKSHKMLIEYLDFIENNINAINDSVSKILAADYLFPLGEIYKQIGFKKIFALRHRLMISILVDVLIGITILKFPYPILTILVIIDYYTRQKKYMATSKVYGIFF